MFRLGKKITHFLKSISELVFSVPNRFLPTPKVFSWSQNAADGPTTPSELRDTLIFREKASKTLILAPKSIQNHRKMCKNV